MRVLLTGASGSLGQQVLISLLKFDYEVACLINHNTPTLSALDQDRVTLLRKQLVLNGTDDKLEPFDCIIHCATQYGRNSENEENIRECNLELPIKILRSAMLKTDGLFINSDTFFNSSIELSGTMNFYSATKSELRAILSGDEFAGKYKIVNAIIYQMFGLNDDESKFVPSVIKKIVEGEQKIPMTPGLQTRDFISVDSVADIYMRLLKKASALVGFSQIEVGNGLQTSVKEFVGYVQNFYSSHASFDFGKLPYRKNEIMHSSADTSGIEDLGYLPKTNLDEVFGEYLVDMKKRCQKL